MTLLAIDPGSSESATVALDGQTVVLHQKAGNPAVLGWLADGSFLRLLGPIETVVIEWTAPRGMPASEELFETMWWAGRMAQAAVTHGVDVQRLPRAVVKRHLCGTSAAKDANVRQALIDLFGGTGGKEAAIGRKAAPGPLFGVTADQWAALAVAVTYSEQNGRPW